MRFCAGIAAAVVLAGWAGASAGYGANYDGVVVFGDSLSDAGNVFAATGGNYPYPSGRYSNGPVWAEDLAAHAGVALSPSLLGGGDYAYGSAATGTGTTTITIGGLPAVQVPNIGQQVQDYLTGHAVLDPNTLYVLWGGTDDFLNGQVNPAVPAGNIASAVGMLAGAGARRILVNDLPNLGLTPAVHGTPLQAAATQLSLAFNALLTTGLATISGATVIASDADKAAHPGWDTNPGLTLFHFQTDALIESLVADPGAFGLSNVTDPVLQGGVLVGDPQKYLFFDTGHPTAAAHAILGDAVSGLVGVPEPGALLLMAMGSAGLLMRRRRQR